MYPTVVIVLVETQRSMTDLVCELNPSTQTCRESDSILPETSNRLSFPVETKRTIPTDKESSSEQSCTSQVEDGQQHDWGKVFGTAEKSRQLQRTQSIESDSV